MAQDLAFSYAAITKSEKQADGTLRVYGKATDDSIDIDQQICDDAWLQKAMPDWFVTGGNIREQHSNIAAGVATEYEAKSDGHYITALVVDPTSVKKVETGVLKGFSIGIRGPRVVRDSKAAGGRIIDGQIVEISLVDRPANPNAKMTLAKAAENGDLEMVEQMSIPTPADVKASLDKSLDHVVEGITLDSAAEPVAEAAPEAVEAAVTAEEPAAAPEPAEPEEAAESAAEPEPEEDLVEVAKGLLATVTKFSQSQYDAAINALSDLVIVEAGELKEGHDERASIRHLLQSIEHLFAWYAGEAVEGEIANPNPEIASEEMTEDLYLAADEMCKMCGKAADLCMCMDKSAEAEAPADAEAEPEATEEVAAESTEDLTVSADAEEAIIAKAVASAKAIVSEEVAKLKSAFEAEKAKAAQLEDELTIAKQAAVGGGPKRAKLDKSSSDQDINLIQQVAALRVKAAATTDAKLREGYKEWADELEAKATKG
jgi:hypothetical protein